MATRKSPGASRYRQLGLPERNWPMVAWISLILSRRTRSSLASCSLLSRFRLECTASPNTTLAILLRFKRLGRSSDAIPAALVALHCSADAPFDAEPCCASVAASLVSNGVAAALEGVLLGLVPGADRMVRSNRLPACTA